MFTFVFKVIFAGFFLFSAYELFSSQKNERVTLFLENYKSHMIPQIVKTFRLKEMGLSKAADYVSVMPDLSRLEKCKCYSTKIVAYVLLGCSFLLIFRLASGSVNDCVHMCVVIVSVSKSHPVFNGFSPSCMQDIKSLYYIIMNIFEKFF